jgi:transposase
MEYQNIVNYPLSQDANDQLLHVMKSDTRSHVRNRAHTIILLFEDHRTFEDVADIFKVHVNTIRNWAERWVGEGIEGLYDLEGRGAKPIFSDADEKLIIKCLDTEPRSLKQVAAKVEQQTGKTASSATYRRIIKKHGKSWKRQRKILKGAPTKEEYEQGKADIEELKQLAQDGEFDLVHFDVSGFTLQPCVPYAWQDIGREGTLGIPSSYSKRINVLGVLNTTKNKLTAFEHVGSVTSAVIIDVIDTYCDSLIGPTVMMLDNASVHTSKAIAEKCEEWEKKGLTLYFIPRYSPQLNLIEILWHKIKYEWLPSCAYLDMDALKAAIRKILYSFGSEYTIQFAT